MNLKIKLLIVKKREKKFDGSSGIRIHAEGTVSAINDTLQTLTSQGQTPCPIATIFKKLLGGTIADTMLENCDPVF